MKTPLDGRRSDAWDDLMKRTSVVKLVSTTDIYVDTRFQRALSGYRVTDIKDNYHPQGLGIPLVMVVEGGDQAGSGRRYASGDGQTRIKVLQELTEEITAGQRAYDGEIPADIRCEIYGDGDDGPLSPAEAALLFRLRNNSKVVPLRERDRIAMTEGDPLLLDVQNQTNEAGFSLFGGDDGEAATMPYTDTGRRIVRAGRKAGRPELLGEALTVMGNAYGTEAGDINEDVLKAIAGLMRLNPDMDLEYLESVLRILPQTRILAQADQLRAHWGVRRATAARTFVANEYNKHGAAAHVHP